MPTEQKIRKLIGRPPGAVFLFAYMYLQGVKLRVRILTINQNVLVNNIKGVNYK